jgi:hypothetical protein
MKRYAARLTLVATLVAGATLAPVYESQAAPPQKNTFHPAPKPQVPYKTEYVVTEYNPITGGVFNTYRYPDANAANRRADLLRRVHWVKWRFVGINEPLRSRRFDNSTAAQQFIDSNGPSRSGALGIGILTNETRAVPATVVVRQERVPVTNPPPAPRPRPNPGRGIGGIGKIIGGIIKR